MKTRFIASTLGLLLSSSAWATSDALNHDKVTAAQAAWAAGIVEIGKAKIAGEDVETVAKQLLNELYAFDEEVLFKPTKAAEDPFRNSYDEALSYFVGGMVEEDSGFALQPWTSVRFENEGVLIRDDYAVAMGHYFFTDTNGQETKVEYTFGYQLEDDGSLKIDLHHSSLPYSN